VTKLEPSGNWTASCTGRLLAVAAWLLVNSIRTERIQFAMLQIQNMNNVWRRNAFRQVMKEFELVTSPDLRKTVQVFKDPIAFVIPDDVPKVKSVQEIVDERIKQMGGYLESKEDEDTIKAV